VVAANTQVSGSISMACDGVPCTIPRPTSALVTDNDAMSIGPLETGRSLDVYLRAETNALHL